MLLNDEKETVLRGLVVFSEKRDIDSTFSIKTTLIQNKVMVDYHLLYRSSEKRNQDYTRLTKRKRI